MAGDRAARNEQVVSPCQTVTPAGGGNHTALTTERPACEPKPNMWPLCKQSLSTKGTVRPLSVSGSNTWLPRFPRVWSAVLPLAESATGLMLEIHSVCFMLFSYMCLWVWQVHFTATFFFSFFCLWTLWGQSVSFAAVSVYNKLHFYQGASTSRGWVKTEFVHQPLSDRKAGIVSQRPFPPPSCTPTVFFLFYSLPLLTHTCTHTSG